MTSDHRSTRLRSGPGLSVSATQIDVRRCFFAFQVHFGSDGADAYVLVTYYVQVRRPFHPFLAREIVRVAVPGRSRHASRCRSAIVPATAETHVLARRTVCTVPYAGTIH